MKLFIAGAGSMTEAMVKGWIKEGSIPPDHITITNKSNDQALANLRSLYGVQTTRHAQAAADADIIFLSCKPKDWEDALAPLNGILRSDQLLVSVMAGVTTSSLEEASKGPVVFRAMPNTSAAVRASMTSFAGGSAAEDVHIRTVEHVFSLIGETAHVEEHLLDAVTALTGTGPAYIYYLMESMEKAAQAIGIPEELGRDLVAQTLRGAARRVQEEDTTPAELYKQIMSPGGTTEAGFNVLKEQHVQEALIACIEAANNRSKELGAPAASRQQS
ncbi:pyrroline-5-carboxylate reductase [Alkalicoccus luteus]|uniref:pyrroline-5-carboxylate reductase n=1 Tax=Alkalicoccus luteus TaxID=1237094 RepID=UPI0040342156